MDFRTLIYSAVIFVMTVLMLIGDSASAWIAYDRQAVNSGDYWLLLSCHLVHLSTNHSLLNLTGSLILWFAFSGEVRGYETAAIMLFCGLMTGIGVHFYSPSIDNYYGFSGIVHGCLAAELLITIRRFKVLHTLVILGVIGKVTWESLGFGNLMSSAEFIGGDIAVDAHLYGLVSGLFSGALLLLLREKSGIPLGNSIKDAS